MNKKMIGTFAFAASALALVCTTSYAQSGLWGNASSGLEMKVGEFKLLLAPEVFKGSRFDGYKTVWNRVAKVATDLGWKAEAEDGLMDGKLEENKRVFSYPDTSKRVLSSKYYTLRHRVGVDESGKLKTEKADLTLKYSAKDGKPMPVEAFVKGLPEGTKVKAEVNVYGYIDKQAGKNRADATMSVTYKKQPLLTGKETAAWFTKKYPVIGTMGIPAKTVMNMPTSKYVMTYATNIGKLKRGDVEFEIESCAWYNKKTGKFVTGEVSWRAKAKDVDASYELFNAVQRQASDILDAGKSKNALIK
jgi:hypothetical protein